MMDLSTWDTVSIDRTFVRLTFTLSASPSVRDQEMKFVGQDQCFFINFFHMGAIFCFFPTIKCHPRIPTRIFIVFDEHINILNSVLLPIQAPAELPRTVFPTGGLQVVDRTDFVQEGTNGSSMFDHDFSHFVSWKTYPKRWTFRFGNFSNFAASSNLTCVHAQSGSLAMASITFAAVTCDADEPCSVNYSIRA